MRGLEGFRPAPERLWIRYRPRRWPAPRGDWTDWVRATPGAAGRSGSEVPAAFDRVPDDVVYLPPVEPSLEGRRRDLGAACAEAGAPVLYQRLAGSSETGDPATFEVWDLLPALLEGDRPELWELPEGARAVWPLVAGLTDGPDLVERGLERLAGQAIVVQALALEVPPAIKRRLAEGADADGFDRLFHGPPPSERAFARQAAARGLGVFVDRPVPAGPPRLVVRRRCSGELRLAAELCRRLERPEPESQKLLRAARWVDRDDHDLAALAEEGNLEIVDWLDAVGRELVVQVVAGQRSRLVAELLVEYAG